MCIRAQRFVTAENSDRTGLATFLQSDYLIVEFALKTHFKLFSCTVCSACIKSVVIMLLDCAVS